MNTNLTDLSSDALIRSTHALVMQSHGLGADLLLHLGEVDARKLYRERAFSSMFQFCRVELNFSEDVACSRIDVARLLRRLPGLIDVIRSGRVHLTGLRLLAPHLTECNWRERVELADGKSKKDIEELVVTFAPKPAVPDSIRKLPVSAPVPLAQVAASPEPLPMFASEASPFPVRPASNAAPTAPVPTRARPKIEPLATDAFKFQFTGSRSVHDKVREAQELLRHRFPRGDLADIVEVALDALLAEVKKERFGLGAKPRSKSPTSSAQAPAEKATIASGPVVDFISPTSTVPKTESEPPETRHIPMPNRREVHTRDEGRCTFVSADGRRCAERGWLEFDHLDGFARNPTHSAQRLALKCKAHNQLAAEQLYGADFMRRKRFTRSGTDKSEQLMLTTHGLETTNPSRRRA